MSKKTTNKAADAATETGGVEAIHRAMEDGMIRLTIKRPEGDTSGPQVESRLFDIGAKAAIAGWLDGRVSPNCDIHATAQVLCVANLPDDRDWPVSVIPEDEEE